MRLTSRCTRSADKDYGIILAMRDRPRKNSAEGDRRDFRQKSSRLSHANARPFRESAGSVVKFGQQPGLRPEPRLDAQCARAPRRPELRLDAQRALTADGIGIGCAEGVRGRLPPVDVGRRHVA